MKISNRLIVGFGIILILILGLGLKAINDIHLLADQINNLYTHPFTVSNAVLQANADIIRIHRAMKDVVLSGNAEEIDSAILTVDQCEQRIFKNLELIEERFLGERSQVKQLKELIVDWKPIREEVIALVKEGKKNEAAAITKGKGAEHVERIESSMKGVIEFAQNKAIEFKQNAETRHNQVIGILLLILMSILIISAWMLYYLYLSIHHEIDERKKNEINLRENEKKFRLLYEQSPLGYQSLDSDGRFIEVNPVWLETLGYTRDEVIGAWFGDFLAPEYLDYFKTNFPRFKEIGEVHGVQFEMIRKDNERIFVEFDGRIGYDDQGNFQQTHCVLHDITERQIAEKEKTKLEEQLRQSQKMEAIGKLAGGVAHDFNNLLMAILGYSSFVLNDPALDDALREDVIEIQKAAERAEALIRQLLAFSRKQILQPKVLNLNELIANIEKMLKRVIGEDIELITVLTPNIGYVKADPGQLEQVVMNLAVNARDAMPTGGKLILETSNINLDYTHTDDLPDVPPRDYIMLAVSDTGCGIDKETQKKIFEPFFTTKEKDKGTGLGLSTVYGIIKQSGGNVRVYSEPGKGTTFKIYLPIVREENSDTIEDHLMDIQSYHGTETILLVEDEGIIRKLTARMLKEQGYEVIEADSGELAMRLYKEMGGHIDLLITDIVMTGISGKDLSKRLMEIKPALKVLFMSGYTDNAIIHHGILDEGLAFIQKPVPPKNLIRKVREILDTK